MEEPNDEAVFAEMARVDAEAKRQSLIAGIVVLMLLVFFCIWRVVASDFGVSALSGTYTSPDRAERLTLILKPDHTFHETLNRSGKLERADGGWYVLGESGIRLSRGFIKVSGQESTSEGEVYGRAERRFGLFLSIVFQPDPGGLVIHKRIFS
jgi:hypothetical protein